MRFSGVVCGNDPALIIQLKGARKLLVTELIMQPLNLVVVIAQACTDVVIDAAGAVVPSKRKLCATGQEPRPQPLAMIAATSDSSGGLLTMTDRHEPLHSK